MMSGSKAAHSSAAGVFWYTTGGLLRLGPAAASFVAQTLCQQKAGSRVSALKRRGQAASTHRHVA